MSAYSSPLCFGKLETYDVAVHQPSARIVRLECQQQPSATRKSCRVAPRRIVEVQWCTRVPQPRAMPEDEEVMALLVVSSMFNDEGDLVP